MSEEKEFELRPDGRVFFRVGAESYVCRRPTVGELGKILELRAELVEKEQVALKAKPSGAKHSIAQAQLISGWTVDALGMLLTTGSMPAGDDLPGWATSVKLPDRLVEHWQEVPLGPSGP